MVQIEIISHVKQSIDMFAFIYLSAISITSILPIRYNQVRYNEEIIKQLTNYEDEKYAECKRTQ